MAEAPADVPGRGTELRERLRALGAELGAREAEESERLAAACAAAARLHRLVADALAAFHEAVRAAGAPQLEIALEAPHTDDKHLRAVQFALRRGRHAAIVTVKSRGEVTLVGPFRQGKDEGPCKTFPLDAPRDVEAALGDFVSDFLRAALAALAPGARVEGAAVESGVPDQPVGFGEIVAGARGRARAAFALGGCELAVGYEDGLVEIAGTDERWFNVGCAVVVDGRREAAGFSSGFAYPPACAARAVAERAPIGDLFDALWASARGAKPAASPSAVSVGNVGKLTDGALPRAGYASHAVLCALVSFLHPELYAAPGGTP